MIVGQNYFNVEMKDVALHISNQIGRLVYVNILYIEIDTCVIEYWVEMVLSFQ